MSNMNIEHVVQALVMFIVSHIEKNIKINIT
jgi:hypothetical protein